MFTARYELNLIIFVTISSYMVNQKIPNQYRPSAYLAGAVVKRSFIDL